MTTLPTPSAIQNEFPLDDDSAKWIETQRKEIQKILSGESHRFLLIVGPCSIHDSEQALDYAKKLKPLIDRVADTMQIVMRVYCEKPRTALGWQGLLFDPTLDGKGDVIQGIRTTRELMAAITKLRIPIATEFLDPLTTYYYSDFVSWGSIGARTTSSQVHRQLASGLPLPVGFKNGTDGKWADAVNGIKAASHPQTHIGLNASGNASLIHTKGNPAPHLVLRGGVEAPNYDDFSLGKVTALLRSHSLSPNILIDCSHDNSGKDPARQPEVFNHVLETAQKGAYSIVGALLESNILAGKQPHLV